MIKFLKKNLHKIILTMFVFIWPIISFAQGHVPAAVDQPITIANPLSSKTLIELIQKILEGVLKIGMPIVVLAIIYCGFLFVSAQGNPEKLGEAKRALLYTLIGAAILLGSWAIALLITSTVKAL